MRVINGCILAWTALALLSGGRAQAQDLFSSTNTTTHSYNFVEAQYLVGIDASPPVLASVLLDVWHNWSIKGEFLRQDFGNVAELVGLDSSLFDVNAELTAISVGGLYHQPLSILRQSDWIAGFLIGWGEGVVESEQLAVDRKDRFSFQEVYAGFRKTLAARLEGELTLNYLRSPGADTNEFSADVKLVYRVVRSFDVALSGNTLGGDGLSGNDGNILGIGFRYTW